MPAGDSGRAQTLQALGGVYAQRYNLTGDQDVLEAGIKAAGFEPDPLVHTVRPDELDILLPASIAMFTEEVGVSPIGPDGDACSVRVGDRTFRAKVSPMIGDAMPVATKTITFTFWKSMAASAT